MTQFGNIRSLNRAMFVDVTENHLFLLDGIKTSLPDIGSFLPSGAVHLHADEYQRSV
ncbi:MAG: hypothetical protein MUO63_06170 [Desulfobulbaceae bacterium]|nr:hypothetical protein [Desulfobulbaceae bacterium]